MFSFLIDIPATTRMTTNNWGMSSLFFIYIWKSNFLSKRQQNSCDIAKHDLWTLRFICFPFILFCFRSLSKLENIFRLFKIQLFICLFGRSGLVINMLQTRISPFVIPIFSKYEIWKKNLKSQKLFREFTI